MDALFPMNVFFADQPSGWIWGHSDGNWKEWVFGGILFLLVCCFIYDGIKNRDKPWWRNRGPMGPIRPKRRRKGGWWSNTFLVQLWRDAPPEITTWGKIWRTALFVGFWVIVLYTIGVTGVIDGGPKPDGYDGY